MQSKRVLVTGANGQLGNEMRRLGAVSPNEYIFTDVAELDITNRDAVMAFVKENNVNIIVNCAAYTNVDKAEDDEATAELINATAVRNLAEAIKVVSASPKWKPAKVNGNKVRSSMTIPVEFRLEKRR